MSGLFEGTFLDVDGNMATTADRVYLTSQFVTHGPYAGDPAVNDPYTTYGAFLDPMPRQPTRPYSPQTMDPGVEFDDQGLSVQLDWDLTDNLSLKWVSAMREYHDIFAYDTDASPFHSNGGTQGLDHEHTSHEFRFSGVGLNERLDYTAGAYYVDQSKAQHIGQINLYYTQLNFVHGPDLTPSDSMALFAHTAWHLAERLDLSLGYRKTEDSKFYQWQRHHPDGSEITVPCVGIPDSLANQPNCSLLTPAGVGFSGRSDTFESDRDDYRIALDYRITDDLMLYTSFATGYKGGGINPRPFYAMQIADFGEEEIETTEIGVKTQFANGTVRLNAAYFQNDQKGIQLNQAQCEIPVPAGGTPVGIAPTAPRTSSARPARSRKTSATPTWMASRSNWISRRPTVVDRHHGLIARLPVHEAHTGCSALVGRARRPRPNDARHDCAVHSRAHLERRNSVRIPALGRRLVDGARRLGVPGRGVHRGGELRAEPAGERPETALSTRTRCPTCG